MKKVLLIPETPRMTTLLKRLYDFYRQGFRSMVLGRSLWKLIAIKLFIIFAVLKLFFFGNYLKDHFKDDRQRADHVLENLTRPAVHPAGAPAR